MATRKATNDGLKLLDKWFIEGNREMQALLDEERKNASIARAILRLREEARLSQRELAKLAGTTASVICQLEDADYEGHSLSMLRRIAAALAHTVEVRFEPLPAPALRRAGGSGKLAVSKARKSVAGAKVTQRGNKGKGRGGSKRKVG